MVPTLVLNQYKRVGTIYFQLHFGIIKREYTYSKYGKNRQKRHWKQPKAVLVLGNALIRLTQTQSFQFTLFLNVSVPRFCLHSETSPPRGLQSIHPQLCQQPCGLDLFLGLKGQGRTELSSSAKRASEVPKTGRENFKQGSFARVYFGGLSDCANSCQLKSH